jgi:hypothetical protein
MWGISGSRFGGVTRRSVFAARLEDLRSDRCLISPGRGDPPAQNTREIRLLMGRKPEVGAPYGLAARARSGMHRCMGSHAALIVCICRSYLAR